jgi:2-desacetyl-2-hydroxyethyl bacteriochlorophyllide A dehydrogenase
LKTLVCEQPGQLRLHERPAPVCGVHDVLIRVRRVGVCGTDLHIYAGRQPYLQYPRVMGHEFSGEVVQAPAGSTLQAGDAVYVMPYLSCGHCVACRQDKPNCCVNIRVLGVHTDGALAELVAVPQRFVHAAQGLTLDQAAMIEFLAIGAHAVRRGAPQPGERVLVAGAGPIGIAVALFARIDGAEVTLLDGRADRLAFCRDTLGFAGTVALGPDDEARLAEHHRGEGFEVVFDATGNAQAMERGFGFVGHGGRYVLVSIVSGDIRFSDPEFHKREATLLASRNAAPQDFARVHAALRAGAIPTAALATHRLALDTLAQTFEGLLDARAGVVKAIVEV